jgi:hypothetical protein
MRKGVMRSFISRGLFCKVQVLSDVLIEDILCCYVDKS